MGNFKRRTMLVAGISLVIVWIVATGGFFLARHGKMTPEKVSQYMSSVNFASLTGDARAAALQELIRRINALSVEDRRSMRLSREWEKWFSVMTDAEKSRFVEATLPVGVTQMVKAFEGLPEDSRRRTIDNAMKRLRQAQGRTGSNTGATNTSPISPELENRMRTIGIKTFLKESSAQSKAEAAVLIEEIQRSMESGSVLR